MLNGSDNGDILDGFASNWEWVDFSLFLGLYSLVCI